MNPRGIITTSLLLAALFFYTSALSASSTMRDSKTDLDTWSTGATMRIDLYHGRSRDGEFFALEGVRGEALWAGSPVFLFDTLNLGDYIFVVSDARTNLPLYSRGFNSPLESSSPVVTLISLRFPFPRNSVSIALKARNSNGIGFSELWNTMIDPSSPVVDISLPPPTDSFSIVESGSPSNKVDIAVIGDGYSPKDRGKFTSDAQRAVEQIFSVSPFKEYRSSFNVRGVFVASEDSGVTSPLDGLWRRTALGSTYNSGGVERRMDIRFNRALREAAATVPYEFLLVIANSRRYGGVGIYQEYSVVAIDSAWWRYLVVHEFAHTMAGLGDEYFTLAECSSEVKPEPWEPNVSSVSDRKALKWRHLVESKTPLPTPWDRSRYAKFDSAFAHSYFGLREQKASEDQVDHLVKITLPQAEALLQDEPHHDEVGAFEGAAGELCGLFRPEVDCTMFTLRPDHFCRVCTEAIERVIAMYSQ